MNSVRALILSLLALILTLSATAPAMAYQISVKQKPGKLRFGLVEEDSIYARAGIQRNDVIREINGKKVDDLTPVSEVEKVVLKGGKLQIERNGKVINMKLKPMKDNPTVEIPPPTEGPVN